MNIEFSLFISDTPDSDNSVATSKSFSLLLLSISNINWTLVFFTPNIKRSLNMSSKDDSLAIGSGFI